MDFRQLSSSSREREPSLQSVTASRSRLSTHHGVMTSDDRFISFFSFLYVTYCVSQQHLKRNQHCLLLISCAAARITYTTPRETIGSFHRDSTGRITKTLLARENKQNSHMQVTTVHDRNDAMTLAAGPMTMPSMAKTAGST